MKAWSGDTSMSKCFVLINFEFSKENIFPLISIKCILLVCAERSFVFWTLSALQVVEGTHSSGDSVINNVDAFLMILDWLPTLSVKHKRLSTGLVSLPLK